MAILPTLVFRWFILAHSVTFGIPRSASVGESSAVCIDEVRLTNNRAHQSRKSVRMIVAHLLASLQPFDHPRRNAMNQRRSYLTAVVLIAICSTIAHSKELDLNRLPSRETFDAVRSEFTKLGATCEQSPIFGRIPSPQI